MFRKRGYGGGGDTGFRLREGYGGTSDTEQRSNGLSRIYNAETHRDHRDGTTWDIHSDGRGSGGAARSAVGSETRPRSQVPDECGAAFVIVVSPRSLTPAFGRRTAGSVTSAPPRLRVETVTVR